MVRRQGGASGCAAVLPDGRFLRNVLRRCGGRGDGAGYRADPPRRACRAAHRHVRRAGGGRGRLSGPADPARLSRGGLRADGRPEAAHRQGTDPPRSGAAGHARHADRGRAAGGRAAQSAAGAGAGRMGRPGRRGWTCPPACSRPQRVALAALPALLGRLDPAEILAPAALDLGDWAARRAPSPDPVSGAAGAAAPGRELRRRQPGRVRPFLGCRGDGGGTGAGLCAPDPGAASCRACRIPCRWARPGGWSWMRRPAPAWKSPGRAMAARRIRCWPPCSAPPRPPARGCWRTGCRPR